MSKDFIRRRYIVDWKLQGSLCGHMLVAGGVVLASLAAGIFAPLLWNLSGDDSVTFEEQAIVMLYMHERLWSLMLFCGLLVAALAIRFSHRIAGPLVRYKRNLRWVAAGKLPTPLRTRPGDYLQEEVACLNAAVQGIAERVEAIRRAQQRLRAELDAAADRLPVASRSELAAVLDASQQVDAALAAIQSVDPGDDRPPEVVATPVAALATAGDSSP